MTDEIPIREDYPIVIEKKALSGTPKLYYPKIRDYNYYLMDSMITYNYSGNTAYHVSEIDFKTSNKHEITRYKISKQSVLPSYFQDNMLALTIAFSKELIKPNKFTCSNLELGRIFVKAAKFISQLEFQKGTVEITPSNSIKFSLLFEGDRLLVITKPIETLEGLEDDEILFSYFVNRDLILSNAASISEFVDGFKESLTV